MLSLSPAIPGATAVWNRCTEESIKCNNKWHHVIPVRGNSSLVAGLVRGEGVESDSESEEQSPGTESGSELLTGS